VPDLADSLMYVYWYFTPSTLLDVCLRRGSGDVSEVLVDVLLVVDLANVLADKSVLVLECFLVKVFIVLAGCLFMAYPMHSRQ